MKADGIKFVVDKKDVIFSKADDQLHFPFLYESNNGCWYMTYREGAHGALDGDRVNCIKSKDHGISWEKWDGIQIDGLLRFFRTKLRNGDLLSHRYELDDCDGKEGMALILRSVDQGETWKRTRAKVEGMPFDQGANAGMWGHIIEVGDGRLLCGIYGRYGSKYLAGVIESTDQAKSWRYISTFSHNQDIGSEGLDEMDLLELDNGDIISFIRTGTGRSPEYSPMVMSRSKDGGKTWNEPKDLGFAGVSPQILKLENGIVVCSFGDDKRNVCVMASLDKECENWTEPLLVHESPGSAYTDIQAVSEDVFRLVFDDSPFHDKALKAGKNLILRVEISARKKNRR